MQIIKYTFIVQLPIKYFLQKCVKHFWTISHRVNWPYISQRFYQKKNAEMQHKICLRQNTDLPKPWKLYTSAAFGPCDIWNVCQVQPASPHAPLHTFTHTLTLAPFPAPAPTPTPCSNSHCSREGPGMSTSYQTRQL